MNMWVNIVNCTFFKISVYISLGYIPISRLTLYTI